MLGKPGQEVTQNDIDFVTDIIAQQEVMSEPTPFTENQLQYDVNNDNVIDLADKIMLEQIMAGTVAQTQVAPTSQFAATGIQGQMQQQTQAQQQAQQQVQQQIQQQTQMQQQIQQQTQMQQQIQTQMQQQIQAQEEAARRKVAEGKRRQGEQYLAQLMQSTPVEVKTPDPTKIEYVYDPFGDSIFATPAQEALYVGPYAQKKAAAEGGIVSVLGGRHG
jgi:TolA-binding protein